MLGHIHVAGMTRGEIAAYIKGELVSKNLVKDPVVTVEFMNLTVSVLGEVANPGRFNIDKDRLTLLDALSMAGDLTVYGKRENVLVQREENGKKTLYRVNLNSGYDLYASPVYYLQQNAADHHYRVDREINIRIRYGRKSKEYKTGTGG